MAAVLAGLACAACWGDPHPSLERVGALRVEDDGVAILFAACPGEQVERIEVSLADENFEETEGLVWEVQAEPASGAAPVGPVAVGEVPPGFREITELEQPLQPDDHLFAVVTSSRVGTVPLSFRVGDLRSDEVLVRHDRYRDLASFEEQAAESCPSG